MASIELAMLRAPKAPPHHSSSYVTMEQLGIVTTRSTRQLREASHYSWRLAAHRSRET